VYRLIEVLVGICANLFVVAGDVELLEAITTYLEVLPSR
jgi:hypothetical protein